MIFNPSPISPSVQVEIKGPVLLLMGPIGMFFSRFYRYLSECGIPVVKVSFPMHEFGFPRGVCVPFSADMSEWRPFLRALLADHGICHVFMYGDFIIPHRIAIEEANCVGVEAWVFELGYVRPNYVTLERNHVNSRSNLNQSAEYYRSLPLVKRLPVCQLEPGLRWRKVWKLPTFIQHSLVRYRIIEGEHKLQPTPLFLWFQLRGSWRYWIYRFQERSTKKKLLENFSYFLAILQVSSDSQIQMGSGYRGMHDFIEDIICSFALGAHPSDHLAFKHHPRDRGYNNYKDLISLLAQRHDVVGRVHYFHDGPLSRFLRTCRGLITVNSTVGLQALYHAVPTKAMGHTFYNIPGLTDQQCLRDFWRSPLPSDRSLFYRFYSHLITTTQVNGNFDGVFPFRSTFPIAAEASRSRLSPVAGRSVNWTFRSRLGEWFAFLSRVGVRMCWLLAAFAIYGLQLLALFLGFCRLAAWMLSVASATALRALGVNVLLDDSHPSEPDGISLVHIWNHVSPLDVLVVQGVLRLPSITTANLHLSRVLPWFSRSAENAGHTLMDHRDPSSRKAALFAASRTLAERGQIILAPNGSLVTPIAERVSASALFLARRHGALVVPWTFVLEGVSDIDNFRYKPIRLVLSRLGAPVGTIYCRRGNAQDLSVSLSNCDDGEFKAAVQAYYAGHAAERTSEML